MVWGPAGVLEFSFSFFSFSFRSVLSGGSRRVGRDPPPATHPARPTQTSATHSDPARQLSSPRNKLSNPRNSSTVQYCTVLYSTVQYCTVLYSTVQYCCRAGYSFVARATQLSRRVWVGRAGSGWVARGGSPQVCRDPPAAIRQNGRRTRTRTRRTRRTRT